MTDYTGHTLSRTGESPLQFRGQLIAESDSRPPGRPPTDATRWHELALYELEPDPGTEETRAAGVEWPREYIVAVGWRTRWQGESDADDVLLAEDGMPLSGTSEVVQALRDYDPLQHLTGYPPGEHYCDKQQRLEQALTREWRRAVTELLEAAGVESRLTRGRPPRTDGGQRHNLTLAPATVEVFARWGELIGVSNLGGQIDAARELIEAEIKRLEA